jgi:hypothetical protein
MALDWGTVKAEHVQAACARLAPKWSRPEMAGLVVWFNDQVLPAKQVLKAAYRIANGLSEDAEVKFSSGDTMLGRLNRLGFRAERRATETRPTGGAS